MREEKEMGQKIRSADILRTIIGLLLLFVGFYIMSSIDLHIGYVQEFTLLIFSIVGVAVIFGNQALIWFSKPQGRYIKIAIACLIINTVWSMLGGTIVALIFGNSGNQANAVFGDYIMIFFVPFMIMGEELFSIGILETLRTKWGLSTIISTLVTSVIFGLIHFNTYNGGNVLRTIIQILLVQGVARLIFNYAYLKTSSIWTSYAVHLVFDLVFLFVLPFVIPK